MEWCNGFDEWFMFCIVYASDAKETRWTVFIDDGWQKWKSLMTEISGSHSFLTSLLTSNFQDVYHPLGMCSLLLMAKSEMTALFILVSQRRPSNRLALMIPMTQLHSVASLLVFLLLNQWLYNIRTDSFRPGKNRLFNKRSCRFICSSTPSYALSTFEAVSILS